jgi:hypothetical protein
VKIKKVAVERDQQPPDEGGELLDCEGEELPPEQLMQEVEEVEMNIQVDNVEADNEAGNDGLPNSGQSTRTGGSEDIARKSTTSATSVGKSSATSVTLSKFANDPVLQKDCAFLDELKTIFDRHEGNTSTLLLPHICHLRSVYSKARRSIKKRLTADQKVLERSQVRNDHTSATVHMEDEGTDVQLEEQLAVQDAVEGEEPVDKEDTVEEVDPMEEEDPVEEAEGDDAQGKADDL